MSKIFTKRFDDSDNLTFEQIHGKDSKDFKFYQEAKVYKDGQWVTPEELYPPHYQYFAVYKDGEFFAAHKVDGKICINKVRMTKDCFEGIKKERMIDIYETEMKDNFTQKIYTFKDIPEKRKYIIDREIKIYKDVTEKDLNDVLDQIEITFRQQEEKGASNHKNKHVYISYREIEKYNIKTEKEFIDYLNHSKSPLTHEVTHIFQNLFKAFPDVKYTKEKLDGSHEIDYEKYVKDDGEKQARIEQIIELLTWGFTKDEIVELLYSRKYNDKELWRGLVDSAIETRKTARSTLPGDDFDTEMAISDHYKGRQNAEDRFHGKKDRGNNYEQDYLSSGTISNDMFPV